MCMQVTACTLFADNGWVDCAWSGAAGMLSKQIIAQPELTRPLLTPSGLICTAGGIACWHCVGNCSRGQQCTQQRRPP